MFNMSYVDIRRCCYTIIWLTYIILFVTYDAIYIRVEVYVGYLRASVRYNMRTVCISNDTAINTPFQSILYRYVYVTHIIKKESIYPA